MPEMSINSLKSELTNVARSYLWELLIPSPIGDGGAKTILTRCMTTNIPGRSVGNIHVPYKQTAGLEFPGKLSYDHTLECTFIEGEDKETFNAFYSWAQAVVNDRQGTGSGSYSTDMYLSLITRAGEEYHKLWFHDCYVDAISQVPLDQGADGEIRYTVTFRFNWWEDYT